MTSGLSGTVATGDEATSPTDHQLPRDTETQRRRAWAAIAAGAVAVLAAAAFAVGPAHAERTAYSWSVDPASGPPAYTPLELSVPEPERLSVQVPCSATADGSAVFDTDLAPTRLSILVEPGQVLVNAGDERLALVDVEAADVSCPLLVSTAGDTWLVRSAEGEVATGVLERPVTVSHLRVDSTSTFASGFSADILTRPHGSRVSAIQWLWLGVSIGAAMVALVAAWSLRSAHRSPPPAVRFSWRDLSWVDAAVVAVVGIWAVLAPPFFDDGWLLANQRAYADLGTITNDFTTTSSSLPLGYWYHWVWQFLTTSVESPVVLRIGIVALLAGAWLAVRMALPLAYPQARERGIVVVAASVFTLGAVAWLMTFRTEPLIVALTVVCLSAMLWFRRSPSLAAIVIGAAAAGLAFSAHPTGLVAATPLLATIPWIVLWLGRDGTRWLVTVGTSLALVALTVLVAFADTDLALKQEAADALRIATHDLGVLDEPLRYEALTTWGATPPRILSVAMAFIVVLSLAIRPQGWLRTASLPAWSVAAGLVALALMPSKWIWHFGTLVGLVAVAAAVEVARWASRRSRASAVGGLVVIASVALAAATAFSDAQPWAPLDLRSLAWPDAIAVMPWVLIALAIGLGVGVTMAVQRRSGTPRDLVGPMLGAVVVGAAITAVIFTFSVVAADAAVTEGWSFATQNVSAARLSPDCGLGDEITISAGTGAEDRTVAELASLTRSAFVHPDVSLYFPCIHQRSTAGGLADVPDLVVLGPNDTSLAPDLPLFAYDIVVLDEVTVMVRRRFETRSPDGFGAVLAATHVVGDPPVTAPGTAS